MVLSKQFVLGALNLKAEEEKPVLLLICYSFFSGVSIYIFYIVANALFLVNYSKSMLPVAYIAGGVLLFFIGKINVSFQEKVNFTKLSIALIIFQFVSVAIMMFAYESTSMKIITLIMFIWNRISVYVSNVTFWTSSSKIFNLEQAKRIFSLIAIGDVVASILSYFAVNVLLSSKIMTTEQLLYICLVAIVISLGFMLLIIREYGAKLSAGHVNQQKSSSVENHVIKHRKKIFKNDYRSLLLLLGMLPVLGVYFAEFIFSVEVKHQFPVKDQLTAFLGQFFFISAIIELLVKVFFYRFTIRSFGLVSGIIILPLALIVVLALAITFLSLDYTVFFYVLLSRFLCISIKKSFSDTSFQILYQPLPKNESYDLQNKVEIYAKPLGYITAGVLLLFLMGLGMDELIEIMGVFVVILLGWTYVAFRMQTEYQNTLGKIFSGLSLLDKKAEVHEAENVVEETPLHPAENAVRLSFDEIIKRTSINSLNEKLVVISLLGKSKRFMAYKYMIPFLRDKDDQVKIAAIHASGINGNCELWPYIFENICSYKFFPHTAKALKTIGQSVIPALNEYFNKSEASEDVQLGIIEIVKQMEGEHSIRFLRNKLNHPSLPIRHKVYEALASFGYGAKLNERVGFVQEVILQIGFMVWILAAQRDISKRVHGSNPNLMAALQWEYTRSVSKLFNILAILSKDSRLYFIQNSINAQNENTKSYLLEILNMAIPAEHKSQVLPLFEDITIFEKLAKFQNVFPQQNFSFEERLHDIINKDFSRLSVTTKALAIKEMEAFPSEETSFLLVANAVSPIELISEISLYILMITDSNRFAELHQTIKLREDNFHCNIAKRVEDGISESELLINKVMKIREKHLWVDFSEAALVSIALSETATSLDSETFDELAMTENYLKHADHEL